MQTTTESGTTVVRIDGLAPGEYRIGLGPPDGDATAFLAVTVRANETADVQAPQPARVPLRRRVSSSQAIYRPA